MSKRADRQSLQQLHAQLRGGNKQPGAATQGTVERPSTTATQSAGAAATRSTNRAASAQQSGAGQSQQQPSEPKQQQIPLDHLKRHEQQPSSQPAIDSGSHGFNPSFPHSSRDKQVLIYLQGHHGAPRPEHKLSASYSNLTKALESLATEPVSSGSPMPAVAVAADPLPLSRLSAVSTASLQAPQGIMKAQAAASAPADAALAKAAAGAADISESASSSTCSGCGKGGWSGRSLSALGKKWHEHCWRCAGCLQLLQGPYNTGKLDNQPYHPQCFREAFSPRCASCKELLADKYVNVEGQVLHAQCFRCVQCQKPIAGSYKSSKQDHSHYHPECYKQKYRPRCAACGEIVESEGITVKSLTLHSACFKCAACQTPIAGQYSTDAHTLRQYHPRCYQEEFGIRCSVCTKLLEGRYCNVDSAAMHYDCFKCQACKLPIEGSYSTSKEDGLHYHTQCYREHFGKRCAACSKLLEGSYTEVAGRSLHHLCHKCTECKAPIQEAKFKLEGMETYHSACHREKYDPRCDVCAELLPLVSTSHLDSSPPTPQHVCTTCRNGSLLSVVHV